VAEYLTTVTDPNLRKVLTMYRLSEHCLAIEKGRRRQTWLSREDRLCAHCPQNEVETELHNVNVMGQRDAVATCFHGEYEQVIDVNVMGQRDAVATCFHGKYEQVIDVNVMGQRCSVATCFVSMVTMNRLLM
jgi:pectin methylesterase-like acyl-CoA thioesterase